MKNTTPGSPTEHAGCGGGKRRGKPPGKGVARPAMGRIIGVNRFEDLLRWVLGWGRHARVLHPPELAERVREETREMARMY